MTDEENGGFSLMIFVLALIVISGFMWWSNRLETRIIKLEATCLTK